MTIPPHTDRCDRPDDEADARLKQRLQAEPLPHGSTDALFSRVLDQWAALHATQPQERLAWAAGGASAGTGGAPRRWRIGLATGVALCAVAAAALWSQRPDPSIEELMQADVLSQMAIGEM